MFAKRVSLNLIFAAVLLALGFATRFFMLANPAQVVFDEVHFGKFASAYFDGAYYFDIHPPLGKLLIAAGAALGGYGKYVASHGVFDFDAIQETYALVPFVGFRTLPALAGALLPFVAYWFLKNLGMKPFAAFGTGVFIALDNALIVQSRLALMDSFLLLFGFAGLALFFAARNRRYAWLPFVLSGLLFGLSFSVKWTGLSFAGLAGFVWLYDFVRTGPWRADVRENLARAGKAVLCFGIVPFAVYFSVFAIHFKLLPHSGPGDAYMNQNFQTLGLVGKFLELNDKMYMYNTTLSATHPYGSPAWTWPFMARPIYYWVQGQAGGPTSRIYFLGNPLVWFLGTCGVLFGLFVDKKDPQVKSAYAVLFAGYTLNFLPFFDITRVLFLYHYLAALVFSLALFWLWFAHALAHAGKGGKAAALSICFAATAASFLFFAPLTYGLPLSDAAYHLRTWMHSWI